MDEKIKQRIVGTIVITALLAIFLPMLFDDPIERSGRSISEMKIPDLPSQIIKPMQSAPTSTEQVLQAPVTSQPVIQVTSNTNIKTNTNSNINTKVVEPVDQSKKLVRWVIQVGSFKAKKNALAERDKFRKQGFTAFVEAYNNMYRVRIGPELDKSRAEKNQKTLEQKNKIKTMLVPE